MHFSDKGFPLSSRSLPTKPNSTGNDENRHHNCRIGSRIETLNSGRTKHFMAPTVSAASKVVSPSRKKPLAERNSEPASGFIFPDAQNQGSSNLDLNYNLKKSDVCDSSVVSSPVSPMLLSPGRVLGCGDGNGRRDLTPEMSNRPYDPLTNYLSPRPTFLRYNPNRRREMSYVVECENGEGTDGFDSESTGTYSDSVRGMEDEGSSESGAGSSSHDSPSLEGWLDQENGENKSPGEVVDGRGSVDDEEEEGEEVIDDVGEERSCCNLKGLLKLLLVLVVLVLSSAYISSMNSPIPPPALEYIRSLKIEDITSKAASLKGFKAESALQFIRGVKDFKVSVRNFEGESWLHLRGFKDECLKIAGTVRKVVPLKVLEDLNENLDDADEAEMDSFDDVTGHSVEGDTDVTLVGTGDIEKDEVEGAIELGIEVEMTGENLDAVELQEVQISLRIESMEDYYATRLFDMMSNLPRLYNSYGVEDDTNSQLLVNHSSVLVAEKAEISSHNDTNFDDLHQEDEASGLEEQDVVMSIEDQDVEMIQKMEDTAVEAEKVEELPSEQVESWSVQEIVILAAVVSCGILVSLIAKHCSKRKKATPKTNKMNATPFSKAGTPDNNNLEYLSKMTETIRQTDYVDSLIDPLSNIHLEEDVIVTKDAPVRIRAPKVELLSEVVFGEMSNQLKNCSMRSVMTNGIEESSCSISDPRTTKCRRECTDSSRLQVTPFEVSVAGTPSRSSFTVEEKETGGSGSNMSTPVRRSSRIRNRGVTPSG